MSLAEARKLLDAENKAKRIFEKLNTKKKETTRKESHLKLVVNNNNNNKKPRDKDDLVKDVVRKVSKQLLDELDSKIAKRGLEKVKSVTDKKYMDEHKHAQLLRPTLESMFDEVLTRKNLKVQKKVAKFETDFRPDFYVPEKKMFVVVFTIWTLYEEARATWKRNRRIAAETAEEGIKIKWAIVDHFHNKTSYFVLPKAWPEWDFKELQYYCRHAKWKEGVDA